MKYIINTNGNQEEVSREKILDLFPAEKLREVESHLIPLYNQGKIYSVTINITEETSIIISNEKAEEPKKIVKKKPKPAKYGVIYVMRMGKYYKIGRASLTFNRLGEYTKLPETPEYIFVGVVLESQLFEQHYHELFKEKNVRGEWFELDIKDLNSIGLYLSVESIFQLDKDGVEIYNENYEGCENSLIETELLRRARRICEEHNIEYDEKHIKFIINQRDNLIERFRNYDDFNKSKVIVPFNRSST